MPSPLLWFQFPVSLFLFLLPSVFLHLTPPFSSFHRLCSFSSSSRLSGYIFLICSSLCLSLSVLILPSHSAARRPQTASDRAAQTRIKRKSSAVFCLILPSPYLASSSSSSSSSTQTISQSFLSFVSFSTHSLKFLFCLIMSHYSFFHLLSDSSLPLLHCFFFAPPFFLPYMKKGKEERRDGRRKERRIARRK